MTRFKRLSYLLLTSTLFTSVFSHTTLGSAKSLTKSTAVVQTAEQTLILCETDGTAVRIYEKGIDTFMRAFNRRQKRVFMNDTAVGLGEMPNATSYRNLLGELSVTVLASKSADECSILINGQASENGRLLVNNRTAGGSTDSQITPIETRADDAVTGTISYRARIGLQPGAIVTSQLINLTTGQSLAEQTITTTGEQVPIPFTLAFNPSDIVPGHRYVIKANIFVDDELRWTTDTDYPVITQRSPLTADLLLVMTDSSTDPNIQPVPSKGAVVLPESVEQAVKAAFTNQVGATQFTIANYSRETWSDGCLGLGRPDEGCLSALTEGWKVNLLDSTTNLTYIYRTNENGSAVRLESKEK